jgi:hypothetical protein
VLASRIMIELPKYSTRELWCKVSVERLVSVITTHYHFPTLSFDSIRSSPVGFRSSIFSYQYVDPDK